MNQQHQPHHLMNIVERPTAAMIRGQGSYLWDDAERVYLDFVQGWAVNALGHAPEEVAKALYEQARSLLTPSPAFHNAPQLRLATRLCNLTGLSAATFCSSGAEAIETALKICRKWGRVHKRGAYEVISTLNAFHGRTLAAMAASGKPGWEQLFPPYPPGFIKVPFGSVEAVEQRVGPETVAILVEPIQGEAGAVVPPASYLRELRQLADAHDLLLVFDEVQTGIGRTGTLFAFEQAGVLPDVITLGKGLGAGVPLSAVLVNERANVLAPGDHGGTFNGNPLMTAVGCAVLDVVAEPGFLATVRERATQLQAGLELIARRFGGSTRGQGLLQALVLPADVAERIRDACHARGLLVNAARPNVLRFMPQLRVSEAEIAEMLAILTNTLQDVLAPHPAHAVAPREPGPERQPNVGELPSTHTPTDVPDRWLTATTSSYGEPPNS